MAVNLMWCWCRQDQTAMMMSVGWLPDVPATCKWYLQDECLVRLTSCHAEMEDVHQVAVSPIPSVLNTGQSFWEVNLQCHASGRAVSRTPTSDCLIGLVVKASPSRNGRPGFDSRLCNGPFFRWSHTSDVQIVTPVATLPGGRH